jgi:hypothetical protein
MYFLSEQKPTALQQNLSLTWGVLTYRVPVNGSKQAFYGKEFET